MAFLVVCLNLGKTRIAIKSQNKRRIPLSIQSIVACCGFAQGCDGGLPFLAVKCVHEFGIPSEVQFNTPHSSAAQK